MSIHVRIIKTEKASMVTSKQSEFLLTKLIFVNFFLSLKLFRSGNIEFEFFLTLELANFSSSLLLKPGGTCEEAYVNEAVLCLQHFRHDHIKPHPNLSFYDLTLFELHTRYA